MITDSYITRNLLYQNIVDAVNDYLEYADVYPEDSCIAIQKNSLEIELLTPAEADRDWETFPIATFLLQNQNKDEIEVDIDAAYEVAGRHCFIR